jgi:protein O-GlcNAc transferase
MLVKTARALYEACPLCESTAMADLVSADCTQHACYSEELGSEISWRGCQDCGHVFTDGYFTGEALESILSKTIEAQVPGFDANRSRQVGAKIVTTVSSVRGDIGGRWLDVGIGNGGIITSAAEFGYEAVGIDQRTAPVNMLRAFDYEAHLAELHELGEDERFDVISFEDSLEHMPFPKATLREARRRLNPDGLLFISLPNMDSFTWKLQDELGLNAYWSELEHFHNFDRARLYATLLDIDMVPCHFAVSERYPACMEVIARMALPGE